MEFTIVSDTRSSCCSKTGCCEENLPVAVLGAGPIGLAAAAHLYDRHIPFVLFEAEEFAHNVRSWGHVSLFSPWAYTMDAVAKKILQQGGWEAPNEKFIPTGKELFDEYLQPLAQMLAEHIYTHHRVMAITREQTDRLKSANREQQPFLLYVTTPEGMKVWKASAVIDATGTWGNPNPAMSHGVWLPQEQDLREWIDYHIPNVHAQQARFANRNIAVVGAGHSAINSLLQLAELKQSYPQTEITWVLRKKRMEEAFGGGSKDELAARGELGLRIAELVNRQIVQVVTPFHIQSMEKKNGIVLTSAELQLGEFDRLIVNTGSRPSFDIHRELRFEADAISEAVPALAPLIDPNEHSCGTVKAHGEKELRQPEPHFYIVGSKSYGRAPTFLLATGYEQVRSVVAFLAGDVEAAAQVQLSLPETGVCHSGLGGCC